jgi:uncharacterized protein (UPF0371 family)
MKKAQVSVEDRPVIGAAMKKSEETKVHASALELPNGEIITGKTSDLLGASSALLLNALKRLAGIDDSVHLISPSVLVPIQKLKLNHLGNRNPRLHTDETLIALSICAASDENAKKAMDKLSMLKGLEYHSSVILSKVDENVLKRLGLNVTCQSVYR